LETLVAAALAGKTDASGQAGRQDLFSDFTSALEGAFS
jgi:hypothetical protein